MPQLVVEKGNDRNDRVRIQPGDRIVVGRDAAAHLRLRDTMTSRKHFAIIAEGRAFVVKDLESANGTFLNGKRIATERLNIGDRIQVGETLMSFLNDDEASNKGGLIGKEVAGYRIEERLGRGAMGTVYRATQTSLDRTVALKILAPELVKNQSFIDMFLREARACAKLNHPNIIQVYDVNNYKGVYFFSMEYVSNGSVQERIANGATLPTLEAIPMVVDACQALDYAERKSIVHRDIKPDNLFLDGDNRVKIGDLGLAHSMDDDETSGQKGVFGTPHYIAPEQALGDPVDHRADIYALGCTFFRMLTGRTAYLGDNVQEILRKQVKEPPPYASEVNEAVPRFVADIVYKMMAKLREDRYQHALEIIPDLERCQRNLTARAPASTPRRGHAPTSQQGMRPAKPLARPATLRGTGHGAAGGADQEVVIPSRAPALVMGIVGAILFVIAGLLVVAAMNSRGGPAPNPGGNNNNAGDNDNRNNGIINAPNNGSTGTDDPTPGNPHRAGTRDWFLALNDEQVSKWSGRDRAKWRQALVHLLRETGEQIETIQGYTRACVTALQEENKLWVGNPLLQPPFDDPTPIALLATRIDGAVTTYEEVCRRAGDGLPALRTQVQNLIADARYREALDACDQFLTATEIPGDIELEFPAVPEHEAVAGLKTTIDSAARTAWDALESALDDWDDEMPTLTMEDRIRRVDELMGLMQPPITTWGIQKYLDMANARIDMLRRQRGEAEAELDRRANQATPLLRGRLDRELANVVPQLRNLEFATARDTLEAISDDPNHALVKALADGGDSAASGLLKDLGAAISQLDYGAIFMAAVIGAVERAKPTIRRPSVLDDHADFRSKRDVDIDRAEVSGVLIRHTGNPALAVAWADLGTGELLALIGKCMNLSVLTTEQRIGYGVMLIYRDRPEDAYVQFDMVRQSAPSELRQVLREFLAYALLYQVDQALAAGDGKKATELLKKLRDEYGDTRAVTRR